jgi:hypothetical protein
MTKQAISGQSNFSGTTIEGRIIVAKKSPQRRMRSVIVVSSTITLQICEGKKGDLVRCQKCNIWYHEA